MYVTDVAHSFAGQRQVLTKGEVHTVPFLKPGRKVPSIGTNLGKSPSKAWQEHFWQSNFSNREAGFPYFFSKPPFDGLTLIT